MECLEKQLVGRWSPLSMKNFNLELQKQNRTKYHQEPAVLNHLSKISWGRSDPLGGGQGCSWGEKEKTVGCLHSSTGSPANSSLATAAAIDFFSGRYSAPTDLLSWRFNHIQCFCSTSPLCAFLTNKTNTKCKESWQRQWDEMVLPTAVPSLREIFRHQFTWHKYRKGAKVTQGSPQEATTESQRI